MGFVPQPDLQLRLDLTIRFTLYNKNSKTSPTIDKTHILQEHLHDPFFLPNPTAFDSMQKNILL